MRLTALFAKSLKATLKSFSSFIPFSDGNYYRSHNCPWGRLVEMRLLICVIDHQPFIITQARRVNRLASLTRSTN